MSENINSLRKKLGMSQERLARLLSVSISTVVRAEKSGRIPRGCEKKTANLIKVLKKLEKAGEPEEIAYWLTKPNPDLQGYSPIDLVDSDYGVTKLLNLIDSWS